MKKKARKENKKPLSLEGLKKISGGAPPSMFDGAHKN